MLKYIAIYAEAPDTNYIYGKIWLTEGDIMRLYRTQHMNDIQLMRSRFIDLTSSGSELFYSGWIICQPGISGNVDGE